MKTNKGILLTKFRDMNDLTQSRLAKLLGYKSPQHISNIERGVSAISASNFARMARALNIKKDWAYEAALKDFEKKFNEGWNR